MLTFAKRFFTDESLFERSVRGLLFFAASAIGLGADVSEPKTWIAPGIALLGGMVHAGDKNAAK